MQVANSLDQLNALLQQVIQSGQPIDPDAVAPGLQALMNSLAMLSQMGQENEGQEQGQPGEAAEPPMPQGAPPMGRGGMPGFGG